MYKLFITELAEQDLEGIVCYIVSNLGNPDAASSFLDEVEKTYAYLKKNPYFYSKSYDSRLEREGYRKALIKNYILIFKVDEEQKIVTVYRFFYGARDYFKLI